MTNRMDFKPPNVDKFIALRQSVGWSSPTPKLVQQSIKKSLFWVCLYSHTELIACARVIGDGAMYFYIQDVIVHPEYQRQGLGKNLMINVEKYLSNLRIKGATIGLLAAYGKEEFYTAFGYSKRDGEKLGFAMCKFI